MTLENILKPGKLKKKSEGEDLKVPRSMPRKAGLHWESLDSPAELPGVLKSDFFCSIAQQTGRTLL